MLPWSNIPPLTFSPLLRLTLMLNPFHSIRFRFKSPQEMWSFGVEGQPRTEPPGRAANLITVVQRPAYVWVAAFHVIKVLRQRLYSKKELLRACASFFLNTPNKSLKETKSKQRQRGVWIHIQCLLSSCWNDFWGKWKSIQFCYLVN